MAKMLSNYEDDELIKQYQKDFDAVYVGELFRRYSMLVYGLSYKYLKHEENAKDAVAEIFEYLLEKLKDSNVTFFKSWLYTVAKNQLIKKINKINSLKTIDLDELPENNSKLFMENEQENALNSIEENENLLQQAISNLNDEQKTCIELFYYKLKPYQEVASITGYDLNKVKSAIQNGKRNLKLFMEEKQKQHAKRDN